MTDPRADTIRAEADTRLRAAIIEHFPDGYDQVDLGHDLPLRREALAILDGLLADAAERERRKQEHADMWNAIGSALFMGLHHADGSLTLEPKYVQIFSDLKNRVSGCGETGARPDEGSGVAATSAPSFTTDSPLIARAEAAEARVAALETSLREIEEGTTPDRIGRYDLLRDWIHGVARAALAAPAPAEESA